MEEGAAAAAVLACEAADVFFTCSDARRKTPAPHRSVGCASGPNPPAVCVMYTKKMRR